MFVFFSFLKNLPNTYVHLKQAINKYTKLPSPESSTLSPVPRPHALSKPTQWYPTPLPEFRLSQHCPTPCGACPRTRCVAISTSGPDGFGQWAHVHVTVA